MDPIPVTLHTTDENHIKYKVGSIVANINKIYSLVIFGSLESYLNTHSGDYTLIDNKEAPYFVVVDYTTIAFENCLVTHVYKVLVGNRVGWLSCGHKHKKLDENELRCIPVWAKEEEEETAFSAHGTPDETNTLTWTKVKTVY